MTIEVEHGSVGPSSGNEYGPGVFVYVTSSRVDGGPTPKEVVKAVEAKVQELGLTEVAQVRDYIHNNFLKVAILAVSADPLKAALEQMQGQLHMGPCPIRWPQDPSTQSWWGESC